MSDLNGQDLFKVFLDGQMKLEEFCAHVYNYYNIEPLSSKFVKEDIFQYYQSKLWFIFENSEEKAASIGAFLLLAEQFERHPPVDIEFARRSLKIWCNHNFTDEKVLGYVFNRFSHNREEWISILADQNKLTNEIKIKWLPDSNENALFLAENLLMGEKKCNINLIDNFISNKFDTSLHLFTKQFISIMNHYDKGLDKHFLDQMVSAISNNNLKVTSRVFVLQILTTEKVARQLGENYLYNLFLQSSINAPSPLGLMLYNLTERYEGVMKEIPLKTVARSNSYMEEVYEKIPVETWKEILRAFHTEIKSEHSLNKLQDYSNFSNQMIVKDLMFKTKLTSPLDPFLLCEKLNILVKQINLPSRIEAFTVKSNSADKGMIVLNKNNESFNRLKFTLAHEIGHLLKHIFPDGSTLLVDKKSNHRVSNESHNNVQYVNLDWEKDANDFAHQLLIPPNSKEEECLANIQDSLIENLAFYSEEWKVSMGVLASRLLSITKLEMLLIISQDGEIIYSQTSSYWEGERVYLKGEGIPKESATYDFIHLKEFKKTLNTEKINLGNWDGVSNATSLYEEVFSTGYGKVYTLLYI